MSDDTNQPSRPPKTEPITKTSAVPLRKETVRVTLKAPGAKPPTPNNMPAPSVEGAPAPIPTPTPTIQLGASGSKASTKPPRPPATAPVAMVPSTPEIGNNSDVKIGSNVDLPDVTSAVPLKQETMRVTLKAGATGAPTIPLGNASPGPKPAVAAPTVPLNGPATSGLSNPATIPLATQPLQKSSQPLPKATVQLQQTQELTQGFGAVSQAATIQTIAEEDVEVRRGSNAALPLSIVAFLFSLAVLYCCIEHSNIWLEKHHPKADFTKVFEAVEDK